MKYDFVNPETFETTQIEINDKLWKFVHDVHAKLSNDGGGYWTPIISNPTGTELKFGNMLPRNPNEESHKFVISVTYVNNKEGLKPETPLKDEWK